MRRVFIEFSYGRTGISVRPYADGISGINSRSGCHCISAGIFQSLFPGSMGDGKTSYYERSWIFGAARVQGMKICNIERGLPTVGQAHKRIEEEIAAAKFGKMDLHETDSRLRFQRRGGMIKKNSLPSFLDAQMRKGNIRDYIRGEDFRSSIPVPQRALLRYPDLSGMRTWNSAITVLRLFCCRIFFQSGKSSDGPP